MGFGGISEKEETCMKFTRSSLLMKILLLVLVVYATITLVELQNNVTSLNAQASELQTQIDRTNQEIFRREQDIANADTEEGIKNQAREEGMVEEGELKIYITGD